MKRFAAVSRRAALNGRLSSRRRYQLGSTQYAAAFDAPRPTVDREALRAEAVAYLDGFDHKAAWTADPVRTLLAGVDTAALEADAQNVVTVDAFSRENGAQLIAPPALVDALVEHATTYEPSARDLRTVVRAAEAALLENYSAAAALIGNQALDFGKQDGITEIEESLEANVIERALNDALLADETAGKVVVARRPALVGCVSNFSNFLDLCRKVLRNLELGVPVVILSRSNTGQHTFRWCELLVDALEAAGGIDTKMVVYASCDIASQRRIMAACTAAGPPAAPGVVGGGSPLYLTGSREVARAVMELVPATFASTGGPNTMVATRLTPAVADAARMSALIENSGQCTAMRHLVAPRLTGADLTDAGTGVFANDRVASADEASGALAEGEFAALLAPAAPQGCVDGYERHVAGGSSAVAFKVSADVDGSQRDNFAALLPGPGVDEHWRQVYVDVTSPVDEDVIRSDSFADALGAWLCAEQPITVAYNAPVETADTSERGGYDLPLSLWERSSQVVFSVGGLGVEANGADRGDPSAPPCLTAQARPQDGEIFGELPPRRELGAHTRFPVVVPSSTPAYHSTYSVSHLEAAAERIASDDSAVGTLARACASVHTRGYLALLAEHLADAATGPYAGRGARTALWGLQCPPLNGRPTLLRLGAGCTLDEAAAFALPFALTNARSQLVVSCDPSVDAATVNALEVALGGDAADAALVACDEDDAAFTARIASVQPWNVVDAGKAEWATLSPPRAFPMVGHFTTVLFPFGHVKSSKSNDTAFVAAFAASPKWLRIRED